MKTQARPPVPRASLPTPLAQVLDELDREKQPFRAVHRLVDAIEVVVKLHTVLLVSRFVEVLAGEAPSLAPEVRKLLAGGLRTPSLGIWWAFARDAGRALEAASFAEPVPALHAAIAKKSQLTNALTGDDNLIALRNTYAHGATPDDDACARDFAKYRPKLEALCDGAWPLADAEIVAVLDERRALRLRGLTPESIPAPPETTPGRCYLVRDGAPPLDLHPLLVWLPSDTRGDGAFFYNDLRDTHIRTLHYAWALHGRSEPLRADLLARYPLESWNRDPTAEDAKVRERIAALTESFKGRHRELRLLLEDLAKRDRGMLVVWAPPGMGKSALVARAVDYFSWSEQTQRDAYPDLTPPALDGTPLTLHVVSCFVRRGLFSDVRELFESLNRQIDHRFATGVSGAASAAEAAHLLGERLRRVSAKLGEHERLVVVIDGLDEAAEYAEFVRGLPREAPPRVRVIYTSRPQPLLRSEVYEQIEIRQRGELELGGLSLSDTRALLCEHADKYAIGEAWVGAIAKRSGGNPLYLRLLCDALDRRELDINDVARLPERLSELYDGVLRRVATTRGAESLLGLLAAAHGHLSEPLAQALLSLEHPGIGIEETRAAVRACAEVLLDDPATPEKDWQLFHESLREYLHTKHSGSVAAWQGRLAEWGLQWRTVADDPRLADGRDGRCAEAYALRWTATHLDETLEHRREADKPDAVRDRQKELLALVEDDAWRARSFRLLGNGEALRRGIRLAQGVAVAWHREAPTTASARRVARLAEWTWGEEVRLYADQRRQLRRVHEGPQTGASWRDVVDLAAMGARPRDRVMLAALALRGRSGQLDTRPELGAANLATIDGWIEQADDTAVRRLWGVFLGASAG